MNKTTRRFSLLAVSLLVAQMSWAATPPERINYQGVLRSADNAPLDGTYDMIFRFVNAPVGGTLLLTDYHTGPNAIAVDGGLFTAHLGGGTLSPGVESSLLDVFSNYSPVYVEVQVGAETLAPRVEVVSAGYALNAGLLGGKTPDLYVDTSLTDQVKAGSLTTLTGLVADSAATSGAVRAVNATTLSTSGVAVLGSALAGSGPTEGLRGQSTSPEGRGVVGGAFATFGATTGVYGESHSPDGTGVIGIATAASGGTVGVGGENFSTIGTGVAGVARATSGDAWGVYGETASPTGYGVVSIGDFIADGDIYATGTKYFITEHPDRPDTAIRFACLEGDEIGVYHRGSGRLEQGQARVEFPDPFPAVAAGKITVQVTAEEESGSLYVPRDGIDPRGFTVRESEAGRSNAAFSYLVLAERSGYEDTEALRSISISDKIVTASRLTTAEKRALRAALPEGLEETLETETRLELLAALHEGDFDASCRLVGGCEVGVRAHEPRDRGVAKRESPSDPRVTETPRETGPTDSNVETPATPILSASPVPPSSLAFRQVVSESVEAGDIVVVDTLNEGALRKGRDAHDRGVVGVVAFIEGTVERGGVAPIAVAGVVPCRVDAGYGWIAVGDLLVVSPTPAHAMRASDPAPGTVLGKALESLEAGRGTIRILLTPR